MTVYCRQFTELMKSILLIEDDHFLIDINTTKLKKEGFAVEVATDGETALRKLKEHNESAGALWPNLVVLDIVLPKIDGWEILQEIKKDDKLKNIKILVFTNLGQKAEVEKGLSLGAVKYLIKAQYTPSQMVKEIKKILTDNS